MLSLKAKNILLGKTCYDCYYYRPEECCHDYRAKPTEPDDTCNSWVEKEENRPPITQGEIDDMLIIISSVVDGPEDE